MKKLILLSAMAFCCICCDKSDETNTCFSFDIRQCQTDAFASEIPESDSKALRESKMEEWLEEQGLVVEELRLEIGFHNAVCEACHVCPQGDRYFVRLEDDDKLELIDGLELLSLEYLDCSDAF